MAIALKKSYYGLKNRLYLEAALSFANFTLLNGIFLIGFALALGANEFELGILLAIPLFANLLQLISAFILERTGTKKWTTMISLFFGRYLWILIILIAFGFIGENNPVLLFTVILALSSFFIAIGNLSLLSWIKDLVPVRKLARFLGKRNIYANAGGIVVYLLGSYFIDIFDGKEAYGLIFAFALLIGLVGMAYLKNIPERRLTKAINPAKFFRRLSMPFRDANFRPLLYFGLFWSFAVNLASPFFLVFMIKDLSLSFFLISVFLVIDSLFRIYGLNIWRRIGDRFGARPMLAIFATICSMTPLFFVFVNNNNYLLIPAILIISAVSYAGIDIAIAQVLFKSAPRNYDAYYLSSFTSLTGLISALGPILGGFLAVLIQNNQDILLFSYLVPLKYIFILSFIARVSCLPLISRIHEKRAREIKDIIERIKTLKFVSFFVNIYGFAEYTSKIVLIPQKQFFILQRKTASIMKKDIVQTAHIFSNIVKSLGNLSMKNLPYYKGRLKEIDTELAKHTCRIEYTEGTKFHDMHENVLSKVQSLETSIHTEEKGVVGKAKSVKETVENYGEKLDKSIKKDIEEKKAEKKEDKS